MSNAVPDGWMSQNISDVVTLQYGKSPKEVLSDDGEFPVVGTGGVTGYASSFLHEGNTTIIGRKGTINSPSFISEKFWAIDTTYFATDYREADPKWFYYNLNSIDLTKYNEASGVPSLNRDTLYAIPLQKPPLPEQQKIAAILSSVDDVIEKTQAQIDKLKDLKIGMMQELLSPREDSCQSELMGYTEFKDSPVGRIPVGWDVVPISDHVVETRSGASLKPSDFSTEGFEVIPKKAVQYGGKLVLDSKTYCTREYADSSQKNWVNDEFMITVLRDLVPTGPSIGLIVQLVQEGDFLMAQGVYGFKLDEGLHDGYLAQLSNTDWYRREMRKILVGSTQVHIRSSEFFEVLIPKPPIDDQLKIHQALSAVDAKVVNLGRKVTSMQSIKKGLMQDLLTGSVRVKVGQ